MAMLRVGQRLGKYRLERRLVRAGSFDVYSAYDTVERSRVALKAEHEPDNGARMALQQEVKVAGRLHHPNVLAFKNADIIDGFFVIAYPLAERTLEQRLLYRLSLRNALDYGQQLLDGLAHAHEHRVVHRDLHPANLVLFDDGTLRISDFGVSQVDLRTRAGSSCGTIGYIAPEHAMGRPSARSDVFSTGLLLYRMVTGVLPDWPYRWPAVGHRKLRRRAPELEPLLHRALAVSSRRRFADAIEMREAFARARSEVLDRLDA